MTKKVVSGDDEQRRRQTRVARIQSGLEPEDDGAEAATERVGEQSTVPRSVPRSKGGSQATRDR